MKAISFERVTPDQVKIGDILICRLHDDQLEYRATRVIDIELDAIPGVYTWEDDPDGYSISYDYQLWLVCRHVSLKHPEAEGGPIYHWHHFPWNEVTRYLLNVHNPDSSVQFC